MRSSILAMLLAVTACGSSKSSSTPDGNNSNGDGNGGTDTPGGGPAAVTVTLLDRPTNAAMYSFTAAYQDGAGAWQAAPTPSGDTYTLPINSPVWGFAWMCMVPGGGAARVELAYFTVAERTSLTETVGAGCTDSAANVGVAGTVSGLPDGGFGFGAYYAVRLSAVTTLPMPAQVMRNLANGTSGFTLQAPSGPHDLVVVHGQNGAADGIAIVRGVSAPTTTASVDWNADGGNDEVQQGNVDVGGALIGVTAATVLYTEGNTAATLALQQNQPFTSVGLPLSQAGVGDVYDQEIVMRGGGATAIVENWTHTIADQTYTAPDTLDGATSTLAAATPYPRIATTWKPYTNATGYVWDARQGIATAGAGNIRWTTLLGAGYLGGTPSFQMPDLSALAGWSAGLAFGSGTQVTGTVAALTSSAGATDFPPVNPAASGTQRTTASSDWTVTP